MNYNWFTSVPDKMLLGPQYAFIYGSACRVCAVKQLAHISICNQAVERCMSLIAPIMQHEKNYWEGVSL